MLKNNFNIKKALSFFTFITLGFCSFGQTTITWTGGGGFADPNWSSTANWDTGVPLAADDVVIPGGTIFGFVSDVDIDQNFTVASITFNAGGSVNSFNILAGNTLTVTGNVTLNATNLTFQVDLGSTLDVNGSITNSGTFIQNGTTNISGVYPSTGVTVAASSSIIFDGATAQTIPNLLYHNIELDGNGTKLIANNLSVTGTTTLSNTPNVSFTSSLTQTILEGAYGDLTLSGDGEKQISGTVSTSGTFSGVGTDVTYTGASQEILIGTYGTLQLNGSGTHTINGDLSTTSFSNAGSSVEFNSDSPQTVPTGTYNNLIFSGIGQKNITGTTSVTNTLTSGTGTSVNVSGTITSGTFVPGTSTYNFSSAGSQAIPTLAFYNLTISNSGNKTLSDDLTISNDLTTSGSATLVAGPNTVMITNNFTNDATTTSDNLITVGSAFENNGTLTANNQITVNGSLENNGTLTVTDAANLTFGGSSFSGTSPLSISNLNIGLNGTLTMSNVININPEGTLTITNTTTTIASAGNLILNADATGHARVAAIPTGSSITGNVTSETYINSTNRGWWQLSNAIASPTVDQWTDDFIITGGFTGNSNDLISGSDFSSMYFYNEADALPGINDGWETYPDSATGNASSDAMAVGRGYRIFLRDDKSTFSPKTLDVTGTLNQGDISIPLTYDDNGDTDSDGWNLVGNPYPSSIDWTLVDASSLFDQNAFVWDADNEQYADAEVIAPYQAFFIQNASGNTSLSLTESNKATGGILTRRATFGNRIHVSIQEDQDQTSGFAETNIHINPNATSEFDRDYEKSFLSRNLFNEIDAKNLIEIASRASTGKRLTVNHIPESSDAQEIPLFIGYSDLDDYLLQVSIEDYEYGDNIILIDNYTNTETIFDSEIVYKVKLTDEASRASDRFTLQIGADPVGLEDTDSETGLVIFPNPVINESFNLTVLSAYSDVSVSILDISGNVVYTEDISNSASSLSTAISTENLEAGVYFVNVTSNGNTRSEKLIINK